jgi:WD40 repeat protein/serine/threonine protein kinase
MTHIAETPDLEQVLCDFDDAWRSGTAPCIEHFLPPGSAADPSQREHLHELIKIDLEYRWRQSVHGKAPLLEQYLIQFPALGSVAELPLDLLGEEYRVRHRWGDRPPHAEYAARFPQRGSAVGEALQKIDALLAIELARDRPSAVTAVLPGGAQPRRAAPASAATQPLSSCAEFLETLRREQFVGRAQLSELLVADMQGRLADAHALASDLLRRGWLSAFQVNRLLQGRSSELIVGPYVLVDRLGEGGAGQVFKAWHRRMKRLVALKVIRRQLLVEPEVVSRFCREIEVVSRLAHRHVVRAYDAGEDGGARYLAMEYVEGIDLSRLVKQSGPLPIAQACDYARQAALGLQHIHEHLLVHRDLKPSNLVLDRRRREEPGEAEVPEAAELPWGLVRILDLGLARLCRAENADTDNSLGTLTPNGALMMGTPDYLAPEQALDFHAADSRADLYSLGCTLYYLLTGQPPFPGGTLAQKLLRHQHAEPALTRSDLPAGLVAILRRLMAKHPHDRFQTPLEAATALGAVVAGQPVPLALPTMMMIDLSATPAPSCPVALPVDSSRLPAAVPVEPAVTATLPVAALEPRAVALPAPAPGQTGQRHGIVAAVLLLVIAGGWLLLRSAHKPEEGKPAAPLDQLDAAGIPAEQRFAIQPKELVAVLGDHRGRHWGTALAVTYSPDGRLLASGGVDQVIRLWDPETLQERGVLTGHVQQVNRLAFSPDSKQLASVADDGSVRIWDVAKRTPQVGFAAHSTAVRALAFAPDGKEVASAGWNDGLIRFWDLAKSRERNRFTTKPVGFIGAMAYAPDGTLAIGLSNLVGLVDPMQGRTLAEWTDHKGQVRALAFSGEGGLLASASEDGSVKIWDVASRKLQHTLAHGGAVTALAFQPASPLLATATQQHIVLWDAVSGKKKTEFPATFVVALAFNADGKTLASASTNRGIQLWDPVAGKLRLPDRGTTTVCAVAFLTDGRLASVSTDDTCKLWDVPSGRVVRAVPTGQVCGQLKTQTGLSPGGDRLALGVNGSATPQLWDLASGKVGEPFAGKHGEAICTTAFSPNGKILASAAKDGTIKLWDAKTGTELRSLAAHAANGKFIGLAFQPDGKLLASVGSDGTVKAWDVSSGQLRFQGDHGREPLFAVVFSPDGRILATAGAVSLKLWDTASGKELRTLSGHHGGTTDLAFSPDGQTLVSCGFTGTLRLWEPQSGSLRQTITLTVPCGYLGGIAFSADGHHLATANGDGTIYILRLTRPTSMQP